SRVRRAGLPTPHRSPARCWQLPRARSLRVSIASATFRWSTSGADFFIDQLARAATDQTLRQLKTFRWREAHRFVADHERKIVCNNDLRQHPSLPKTSVGDDLGL